MTTRRNTVVFDLGGVLIDWDPRHLYRKLFDGDDAAMAFPRARERFDFLGWFEGIVVSGEEKLIKPDPRIYRLLVERHGLDPAAIVYIDDNAVNANAATALGMHGIHFTGPEALRTELVGLGLLS